MANEQIIYLSPKEELTNVRERLEHTKAGSIKLVIPLHTQLRSHIGWRLLRSRTRELGQDVLVISSDHQIRAVAKAAGFRVADSPESPPSDRPRASSRPVRSGMSGKTSQEAKKQRRSSGNRASRSFRSSQQEIPPSSSKNRSISSDSEAAGRDAEDIDAFVADYYVARSIREAAQGADAGATPSAAAMTGPSSSKPGQSSNISPPSELEDDPFAYMEDIQPVPLPEQRASTFLQESEAGSPDLSDIPTDVQEVEIEDLSDEGEVMLQHGMSPHASGDQIPEESSVQETPRIYGMPPRSSRMGNTGRPLFEDLEDEDELLPPSVLIADQPGRVTPSSPARSSDTPTRPVVASKREPQPIIQPPPQTRNVSVKPTVQQIRETSPTQESKTVVSRQPTKLPLLPPEENLETVVDQRIEELRNIEVHLAKLAKRLAVRAMTVKTLLICLGVLVASLEIAMQLFSVFNNSMLVIYLFIGVLIATWVGLAGAFKWESRSTELKSLAANCRVERRRLVSASYKAITTLDRESLLDAIDTQLEVLQKKAASLGVNVVLEFPTQPHSMEDLRKIK